MFPNQAGGSPGAMPPMGGGGAPQGMAGQGGGQPSKEEVQAMLVEILTQAKQLADQYGINLASLIPSGGGGVPMSGGSPIPPPPASSPSPMM